MIKARGEHNDGTPLYLLGISEGNVERLKDRRPILVNLAQLGGSGHVCIMYGPTEEALIAELNIGDEAAPEPKEQFPRGQLRADDEGATQLAVGVKDGKLVLDFGKPVTWIGFGIAQAEAFIAGLQARVDEMKKGAA